MVDVSPMDVAKHLGRFLCDGKDFSPIREDNGNSYMRISIKDALQRLPKPLNDLIEHLYREDRNLLS